MQRGPPEARHPSSPLHPVPQKGKERDRSCQLCDPRALRPWPAMHRAYCLHFSDMATKAEGGQEVVEVGFETAPHTPGAEQALAEETDAGSPLVTSLLRNK